MSLQFSGDGSNQVAANDQSVGCCSRLRSEFQCAMVHLTADTPRGRIDWVKAWGYSGIIPSPIFLMMCRFISSMAALGLMIYSMYAHWLDGYWFAYMTHWVMIVNTFFLVLVTLITLWIQSKPVEAHDDGVNKPMPAIVKTAWLLQTTGISTSIILTILFWTLLAKGPQDFFEIWAHGGLMVLILIEYIINGAPYHLAHTLYPFIFASLYTIWNGIFWAAGLTLKGKPWIYEVICWCTDDTRKPFSDENPYNGTSNPEKTAALTLSIPLLIIPTLSLLAFTVGLAIRKIALISPNDSQQKGSMLAFGA